MLVTIVSEKARFLLTEMIRQDGISHRDMPRDTLVKSSRSKYPIRGRQVLLAIQALVLQRRESRISPYLERFARFCTAPSRYHLIRSIFGMINAKRL